MSTTTPAVYVGTYHKYNGGSIAGQWFDLTQFDDEHDFLAECRELHADEEEPELMFQDWEGIPSGLISETHVNWAFIDAYRQAEADGQEAAFVQWADYFNACDYEAVQDTYQGEAESEEDYARDFADETGLLDGMPDSLLSYFDYEAYGRDMFMNGLVLLNGYVFSQ